jgi:hypothetical protein
MLAGDAESDVQQPSVTADAVAPAAAEASADLTAGSASLRLCQQPQVAAAQQQLLQHSCFGGASKQKGQSLAVHAAARPADTAGVERGRSDMHWQQTPAAAEGHKQQQQQQQLVSRMHKPDMGQQQHVMRKPIRHSAATAARVDAKALQRTLSAASAAMAAGEMHAAGAAVAAAANALKETSGSQGNSGNGVMSGMLLSIISQQQQQQMQDKQMPQQARL